MVYPTAEPTFLRRWGTHFSKQKWECLWRHELGQGHQPPRRGKDTETPTAAPARRRESSEPAEAGLSLKEEGEQFQVTARAGRDLDRPFGLTLPGKGHLGQTTSPCSGPFWFLTPPLLLPPLRTVLGSTPSSLCKRLKEGLDRKSNIIKRYYYQARTQAEPTQAAPVRSLAPTRGDGEVPSGRSPPGATSCRPLRRPHRPPPADTSGCRPAPETPVAARRRSPPPAGHRLLKPAKPSPAGQSQPGGGRPRPAVPHAAPARLPPPAVRLSRRSARRARGSDPGRPGRNSPQPTPRRLGRSPQPAVPSRERGCRRRASRSPRRPLRGRGAAAGGTAGRGGDAQGAEEAWRPQGQQTLPGSPHPAPAPPHGAPRLRHRGAALPPLSQRRLRLRSGRAVRRSLGCGGVWAAAEPRVRACLR